MSHRYQTYPTPHVSDPSPVFVEYFQPDYEALSHAFDWLSSDFRKVKEFRPVHECERVSRRARVVPLRLLHLGYRAQDGRVQSVMEECGLRPALYEELLASARKHPDAAREYFINATGSWTDVGGVRHAFISSGPLSNGQDGGRRLVLGHHLIDGGDDEHSADDRFLVIAASEDP